jgi:hypothetical protein
MSTSRREWQFGRIYDPDDGWLAKVEPEAIIEPDIAIVDPHHHLWLRNGHRYLLDELLADINTGHNVVATVFEECHSMYRASGLQEYRCVGETEFVAGIGAMSDSGAYGKTRVAAGIVGAADLTLGDRGRAGIAGTDARRWRPLPRRASLGRLRRRPDHRQQRRRHRAAPLPA